MIKERNDIPKTNFMARVGYESKGGSKRIRLELTGSEEGKER